MMKMEIIEKKTSEIEEKRPQEGPQPAGPPPEFRILRMDARQGLLAEHRLSPRYGLVSRISLRRSLQCDRVCLPEPVGRLCRSLDPGGDRRVLFLRAVLRQ